MRHGLSRVSVEDLRKHVEQTIDFRLTDNQRWDETEHVVSGRVDQNAPLQAVADDCFGIDLDFHTL